MRSGWCVVLAGCSGCLATSWPAPPRFEPGTFTMGCVVGRDDAGGWCGADDAQHEVTLTHAFELMPNEFIQSTWRALGFETNPSYHRGGSKPVDSISWCEALWVADVASYADGLEQCYSFASWGEPGVDYGCELMSVGIAGDSPYDCDGWRLPTEAEWEYAARAGTDDRYAGGDDPAEVAWYADNSGDTTHTVCTTPAGGGATGVCDLSGNVAEWVWDRFVGAAAGGTDPAGPPYQGEAETHVVRGGQYGTTVDYLGVASRTYAGANDRGPSVGVRLARTVPP